MWTSKTLFLRGCISRTEVGKTLSQQNPISPLKSVSHRYSYKLLDASGNGHDVCKDFFCKCLQITNNQTNRAFNTITSNPSAIDRRGKVPPANKIDENDKSFVRDFIKKFPRYRSHYCRKTSSRYYLTPGLNLRKIYREYSLICDFENRTCLKEQMFRDIFNKELTCILRDLKPILARHVTD